VIQFGLERVSATDYYDCVFSNGDLVDLAVDGALTYIWIHINYQGQRTETSTFSAKGNGLFALCARAGEKAEAAVRRCLSGDFGHGFGPLDDSADRLVIQYTNKRVRRPDLGCPKCSTKFEVKKRNRDRNFRISRSAVRPFGSENQPGVQHCLVFLDFQLRFVPNSTILACLNDGDDTKRQSPSSRAGDRSAAWNTKRQILEYSVSAVPDSSLARNRPKLGLGASRPCRSS